jgi:hypothetical protein
VYTNIYLYTLFSFLSATPDLLSDNTSFGVEEESNSSWSSSKPQPGRFAYVFVVSGCNQNSCLGYILNILVASSVFQAHKSTADVVLKVQMARAETAPRLPEQHEKWLSDAGVKLQYFNSGLRSTNFGLANLQKFRILNMIEYDRVLFLDADVMPLCSMDYMFHESYKKDGLFQEQVTVAGAKAPAAGSMFLVTPKAGEYEKLMDLVRQHRQRSANSSVFDPKIGWGHEIQPPDSWNALIKQNITTWDFYGASADQGLLYHWMRYIKMNYTQIGGSHIDTWNEVFIESNHSSKLTLIPVGNKLIARVATAKTVNLQSCVDPNRVKFLRKKRQRPPHWTRAPWSDHIHFSGQRKPWNTPIRDVPQVEPPVFVRRPDRNREVWLYELARANKTFSLGLPPTIEVDGGNPLDYKPEEHHLLDPGVELPGAL